MIRSFFVVSLVLTGFSSAAFSDEPAKTKIYMIEVQVYHGDPLGSKADGNLEILSRPSICTTEGKTASCTIGQKVKGLCADMPCDFAGISFTVRADAKPDGKIRMEIGGKVSEVVEESEFRVETQVLFARRIVDVGVGETFKLRIKGKSATDQTWLEGKVKEIKEVAPDNER